MTAALERGEWSAACPGRTLPSGKTQYPFYRRLGGPQGRSGRAENLVPTGIRSRTVQPAVSRYADWANRPTFHLIYKYIYCYTDSRKFIKTFVSPSGKLKNKPFQIAFLSNFMFHWESGKFRTSLLCYGWVYFTNLLRKNATPTDHKNGECQHNTWGNKEDICNNGC